jgi:hypothetical protein
MIRDSPIFIIALALIAVCGTLGGVWLGSRLTQRNEDRKWRRDRILEVYAEFLGAVERVISEAGLGLMAHLVERKSTRGAERLYWIKLLICIG